MKKRFTLSMSKGFTLIELMIAITIISIMVSIGLSAYGKARDRQLGQNAGEKIVEILQANQNKALIGDKDCSGRFLGQIVTLSTQGTISSHSECESESGAVSTDTLSGITFTQNLTLTFNPLSKGITLPNSGETQDITYVSSATLNYLIRLTSVGTIEYLGIQ